MITRPDGTVTYVRGTVKAVKSIQSVTVAHDGQTVAVAATAQYPSPAVGDRVLTFITGGIVYVAGKTR